MQKLDLKGQKYGRLTVLEEAESRISPNGTKVTMWKCQCECGNIVYRSSANLRHVAHPSCGCWQRENVSKHKLEDLTGQRFGRLVVIERAETTHVSTRWKCKCDCGNECVVLAQNLKKGHTKSCGCFREEVRPKQKFKHGYRHTRIYGVYCRIKGRCYNPNDPRYASYGGRGIKMCDEWYESPEKFCKWAESHGYDPNAEYGECTIDRIDVNGNYEPSNCRFTNLQVQSNNRQNTIYIEHNGMRKTITEWSEFFNFDRMKLYYHLVQKGKTIQELIDKGIV